ncbi:proton-conducting transporter membrane subunit [Paenibacillus beijingensis]|uniref:proton-conducting transporter transmembrane domain-containing protein n=1 Tax=Paenibacillus beijingensis TaxID=1126833 RepID=UPI000697A64B|nr:proton-conducting transporter membrane subunit [Paenibacillus beijingensis]
MAALESISAVNWHPAVFAAAAAAMGAGTLAALREQRLHMLLLLGALIHAGYLLIPVGHALQPAKAGHFGEWPIVLAAYLLAAGGMVAAISAAGRDERTVVTVKSLAGMYHRAPWTAAALLLFLLSLAGMPLTAGFAARWLVMMDAAAAGAYWLAAVAAVSGVIACRSYFGIVTEMYMHAADEEAPVRIPLFTGLVIWLCAAGTVVLGIIPHRIIGWLSVLFGSRADTLIF